MRFFNSRNNYTNNSYEVEHDGLSVAFHEACCDFEELKGQTDIAFSNMYEDWLFNNTKSKEEKQALYEGVIGSVWNSIKEFFKKIGEKIKSWYNAVVRYFQTKFMSDKKFIAKFKDKITDDTEGYDKYSYKAHKWKISAIDMAPKMVADCTKLAEGFFDSAVKFGKDLNKKSAKTESYSAWSYVTEEDAPTNGLDLSVGAIEETLKGLQTKTKDMKKLIDRAAFKYLKGGNGEAATTLTKFAEAYTKEINGGEIHEVVGIDKSGYLSLNDMIDMVENISDKLDPIKEATDNVKDATDSYSDKVDTAVSALDKDEVDESKTKTYIKHVAEVCKYSLSYSQKACEVAKTQLQACADECSTILRGLARYTPVKTESYRYNYGRNNTSLIEQWGSANW